MTIARRKALQLTLAAALFPLHGIPVARAANKRLALSYTATPACFRIASAIANRVGDITSQVRLQASVYDCLTALRASKLAANDVASPKVAVLTLDEAYAIDPAMAFFAGLPPPFAMSANAHATFLTEPATQRLLHALLASHGFEVIAARPTPHQRDVTPIVTAPTLSPFDVEVMHASAQTSESGYLRGTALTAAIVIANGTDWSRLGAQSRRALRHMTHDVLQTETPLATQLVVTQSIGHTARSDLYQRRQRQTVTQAIVADIAGQTPLSARIDAHYRRRRAALGSTS